MKKIGLLFIVFCLASALYAQPDRAALIEKVEARKVAYLSDKLDLSPREAQTFWPLYNAYQDELRDLGGPGEREQLFEDGQLDADLLLDKMLLREEKELEIRRKYAMEFKEAVGARKTVTLFRSERQFKEEMLREFKRRRMKNPPGRG